MRTDYLVASCCVCAASRSGGFSPRPTSREQAQLGKKKKKKPGHDYLGPAGISSKYAVNAFSADGSDQCAAMHLTDVRSASGGGTLECHECHSCVHCIFMSVDAQQSDFEKIDK